MVQQDLPASNAMRRRLQTAASMTPCRHVCCIVDAIAHRLGKGEDELLRLGSGFSAGMGTMEGTCGALVGAIMVSSLLSEKGEAMTASRAIMPRFKELCGATICRDLKGIDTGKVLCSCENCVRNAVYAAAEALAGD